MNKILMEGYELEREVVMAFLVFKNDIMRLLNTEVTGVSLEDINPLLSSLVTGFMYNGDQKSIKVADIKVEQRQ